MRSGYPRSAAVDGNESWLAEMPVKIPGLGEQHDSDLYPTMEQSCALFNAFYRNWRQSLV